MSALLQGLMPHLMVAPILLPMLVAAVMLLVGEGKRAAKLVLGMSSTLLGLAISVALFAWVDAHGAVAYLPGNWPAPFGITLAVDRLSAGMLVLTWLLGASALSFASARWHRAGVHFHPLFQLQLMGLSGAFLTADVFNLFVFFEILLAASYGLLLHGSGKPRVRAGVHYVAVNLAASSLFLIGVAMIYGVTGTLNMAELSARLSGVGVANRQLIDAGAAILAVAFLAKAAAWPLNFWLVPAYASATPPVAAMFAVLTKVGIYALVRLWTLMFAGGPLAGFGADGLFVFGVVSSVLAALGMMASQRLAVQAAGGVMVSAGTLLAALGLGEEAVLGSAVFYLVSSTLASSAFFLLVDVVERWRAGATVVDEAPFLSATLEAQEVNLDDEEEPLVALPFPASTALMGMAFIACTLLISGLPPLSTFIGKVGMLSAALGAGGASAPVSARAWLFTGVLLGCGLLTLIALTRTGIRTFWSEMHRQPPRVRAPEGLPLVALLTACGVLALAAGPTMELASATARSLYDRRGYIKAVLGAEVRPPPTAREAGP
ncbi:monovalent cation/H+ antiporter subunit D [Pyxidicoccus fallax]|uniref:Monovalent cation/H+ antiporter subunit D n=1 Tax=Pyxidicoccus fallax TaxID=394095 RepID=A0A848LLL1_9BACT|nr:monovalent cation/H+ antiporter subunit D [Pyxidicoccus fallax]NMO18648.1 monovalent cation/H+ antiporter subunit D [Pyxidicoccus fallax]NPC79053.1 monovalent cation/H+ antiporter subunit D [Pyxidicoccus fallax]